MDWKTYHSLEDMYSYLDYLENQYDFVTTESIGKSYEGVNMRLAKVCRGGCGNKPAKRRRHAISTEELMIQRNHGEIK